MSTTTLLPQAHHTADPHAPWTGTPYTYAAAEQLAAHMRPGAAVRMAMLLHLAQLPQGISEAALGLVAMGACKPSQRPPSTDDMRVICGHMAAEGLLAAETAHADGLRYYCPLARKAARLRHARGYTLPARIQPAQVAV